MTRVSPLTVPIQYSNAIVELYVYIEHNTQSGSKNPIECVTVIVTLDNRQFDTDTDSICISSVVGVGLSGSTHRMIRYEYIAFFCCYCCCCCCGCCCYTQIKDCSVTVSVFFFFVVPLADIYVAVCFASSVFFIRFVWSLNRATHHICNLFSIVCIRIVNCVLFYCM